MIRHSPLDPNATAAAPGPGAIPVDERVSLLKATKVLDSLSAGELERFAACLMEATYPRDRVVVPPGNPDRRVFIVVRGRAEVSVPRGSNQLVVARLRRGELFGEMALIGRDGEGGATVTAATELRVLCAAVEELEPLLSDHPEIAHSLQRIAEARTEVNFLKRLTPFGVLAPEQLASLVTRLETLSIGPGTTLIRQTDWGEVCYLLRSGQLEVLVADEDQPERRVAILYAGSLVGERALLTDEPRGATVRALTACELIVLQREDLLKTLRHDAQLDAAILALLRQRDRPRAIPGAIAHEQVGPGGVTYRILEHPTRGTYLRVSPEGWSIWQHLDGRHTFKDLTLEYHRQWKSLALEAVAATVHELAKAGFVESYGLRPDVQASMAPRPWLDRAVAAARRVLECYLVVKHADGIFERLYRWGGFLLFTRPCQAGLLLLNVLGLVAFFLGAGRVAPFLHDPIRSGALPLFLIPACVAALALHEAGHGLTTKHYGRRVRSAGIGWYWFGIVAFVDTTDMWGTDRRARIAVSVAGPYTNLLLAATAGFIAWCSPGLVVSATLWQFALVNYLNALINLNPLLEYDGFYILSDLMDRPNLRRECLEWLGQRLPAAIRNPSELRRHWFELLYGVCSLCFVAAMAGAFVVAYRVVLESYLQTLLPPTVARDLPWVVVGALVLATVILSASEMGLLRPSRTKRS